MENIKMKPLHHKLVLTVVSIMLLLAAVTTGLVYYYESEHAHVETEQTLNQLLDTVSLTASIAAYSKNEQIAQDVLSGLLKNTVVQRVEITSDEGFSLSQEKQSLPIGTSVVRDLISPFNAGEVIGKISLHASANYNREKAKQSAIFSIIISVSLITLTTLIILWQVKRHVSAPLSFVSNTLHAIEAGSVKRIPLLSSHKQDELGRLGGDINALLESLGNQFDAERILREKVEVAEQQLRHIYNSSSAGLFVLDEQGDLSNYNSTFTRILNNTGQANESLTTNDLFKHLLGQQDEFALLIEQALGSYHLEARDFPLIEAGRSAPRWLHCLLSKMRDSSGVVVLEGVIFDVTERVHNEEMIKHEAHYDHLTGMLRREPAKIQFKSYLAKNPSANAGFLLLDLDGFKQVNDNYGHLAGDQVLMIVAERLFKCVRFSDVVCRLGGDEFLIILMNDHDVNLKSEVANKMLESISQPISLDDTKELVSVGVSIGMTDLRLSKSTDFETLIKDADQAMYQVKNDGKHSYQVKA